MLAGLAGKLEAAARQDDPTWLGLLSEWIMATGGLREAHLKRSYVLRLSESFLHAHCTRGKQHRNRIGFDFAVPVLLPSGYNWGVKLVEVLQSLPPKRQRSGTCFQFGNPEDHGTQSHP